MAQGTALITGASTGIGAIYADRLAKRGYDLILVARDSGRLEAVSGKLRAEAGINAEVLQADLADRTQLARVEQRITADETLTMLVNNAGIALERSLIDTSVSAVEQLIAINVTAPTLLARAALPGFVARNRGAIINLSSTIALAPEAFEATYSATKAYILNLTQGLSREVGDKGVHVQAVLPGATRTEIWERSGKDVNAFPAEIVMDAGELVDAALVGFDRGETVTIPPLPDESQWRAMQSARLAMAPGLSRRDVASRYR